MHHPQAGGWTIDHDGSAAGKRGIGRIRDSQSLYSHRDQGNPAGKGMYALIGGHKGIIGGQYGSGVGVRATEVHGSLIAGVGIAVRVEGSEDDIERRTREDGGWGGDMELPGCAATTATGTLPEIEGLAVSIAVIVWFPALSKVAPPGKLCMPASALVKSKARFGFQVPPGGGGRTGGDGIAKRAS